MAESNWGLLVKSQVDNETIEEAIDRIVLAHEVDEESHLGAGESLQSHKASEIIDHVAGSVISDKLGSREIQKHFNMEASDPWQFSGSFAIVYGNGAQIGVEYGVADHEYFFSSLSIPSDWFTITQDLLFQCSLVLSELSNNTTLKFGLGSDSAGDVNSIGFKLTGGVLKGRICRGSSETLTDEFVIDMTVFHIYRVRFSASDRSVIFSVDGVDLATLTYPDDDPAVSAAAYFDMVQVTSGEAYITVPDVLIARSVF